MADEDQSVDTSDAVRHGSEDARKAAQERMQAAIDAKKRGENIEVDQASLEARPEDAMVSGASDSSGSRPVPKAERKIDSVKIYSPFHVYYDGDAQSVSAENLTGPFDVLYGHKNFMSLLIPCEVIVRSDRGEERIKIDRGVMHVRANKVVVFLDV